VTRAEIQLPSRPVLSHAADAVRAGGLVFVAGILPVDADGAPVGAGDVTAQAEYVYAQLTEILDAAGCSAADLVRVTVFLTSIGDTSLVGPVHEAACDPARPAATLVEVTGLAVPWARIEIDAVAVAA
jgi:enamine deaminase RidA (YjgF/YER057c/UK114 family)